MYPDFSYELRGPEEIEVYGILMNKFSVFLQMNISNLGRQAEDKLQYAANARMSAEGRENDIPERMKETQRAMVNEPDVRRTLPPSARPPSWK